MADICARKTSHEYFILLMPEGYHNDPHTLMPTPKHTLIDKPTHTYTQTHTPIQTPIDSAMAAPTVLTVSPIIYLIPVICGARKCFDGPCGSVCARIVTFWTVILYGHTDDMSDHGIILMAAFMT